MEETQNVQSSVSTSTTSINSTNSNTLLDHDKSTNVDPGFGKRHEWRRLSIMLIQYIFYIVTFGLSLVMNPNNGNNFSLIRLNNGK